MRDHFPFWRPLVVTFLIGGAIAVWGWCIVENSTAQFSGAADQQLECRVAAAMAKASLPEYENINFRRTEKGWPPLTIGFGP